MNPRKPAVNTRPTPTASVLSSDSSSPLASLFADHDFQLDWDNDLPFKLAEHLIELRRFRGLTQEQLASVLKTSQAQIARLESGEANPTLRSVERIVRALRGRTRFTIEPEELRTVQPPSWQHQLVSGVTNVLASGAAPAIVVSPRYVGALWQVAASTELASAVIADDVRQDAGVLASGSVSLVSGG